MNEQQEQEQRHEGVVKWFSDKRGYGFITCNSTGKEYFVHYSAIDAAGAYRSLRENQRVRFGIDASGKKGPQAIDVTVIC